MEAVLSIFVSGTTQVANWFFEQVLDAIHAFQPELAQRRQSKETRMASYRASIEHKQVMQAAGQAALRERRIRILIDFYICLHLKQ